MACFLSWHTATVGQLTPSRFIPPSILQRIGLHGESHTKVWARASTVNGAGASSPAQPESGSGGEEEETVLVTVRPSYVNDHSESVPATAVGATPRRNSAERANELVEEGVLDSTAIASYIESQEQMDTLRAPPKSVSSEAVLTPSTDADGSGSDAPPTQRPTTRCDRWCVSNVCMCVCVCV